MSGLDSIFDVMRDKMDIGRRLCSIDELFSKTPAAVRDTEFAFAFMRFDISLEKAAEGSLFYSWSGRTGTSSPGQMRELLGIEDVGEIAEDGTRTCHYLQYVFNIANLVADGIDRAGGACDEIAVAAVIEDTKDAAAMLGMEFVPEGEDRYLLCLRDAAILEAASAAAEPDEMADLVSYLHYSNEGSLKRKKAILARLYTGFEGRRNMLEAHGSKSLCSDIGYLCNNLNIRHNNKSGSKAKSALKNVKKAEREGWYDHLAGLYAEAILAERRINRDGELDDLKSRLKD